MQLEEFFTDVREMVKLYQEGQSGIQVAKKVGYTHQFVSEVIKRLGLTRSPGWYWRGNKNPNWNKPNLKMTPALAYILGILYGDGTIDKKRAHVRLTVTKKAFVESFAKAIKGIGLRPHRIYKYNRMNSGLPDYTPKRPTIYYQTGFVSKLFGNWFHSIGLDVIELLLDKPELMREFLRGFYESEGTYTPPPNMRIEMVNTNKRVIDFCRTLLEKLGYEGINISERHRKSRKVLYRLYLRRKQQVERFLSEIKPVIKT